MHQGSHDGLGVEAPVGTQPCHGNGVGDVGFSPRPELAEVGFIGKTVGITHFADVGGLQVVQLVRERSEGGCRSIAQGRSTRPG